MPARNQDKLKHRLRVVERHIENGTGLGAAAKELGITTAGLSRYLDAAGYMDLRREVGGVTRIATSLPHEEHVRRLSAVVREGSQAAACRALGIKPATMSRWLKNSGYGPNYEQDLEDLLDDGSDG